MWCALFGSATHVHHVNYANALNRVSVIHIFSLNTAQNILGFLSMRGMRFLIVEATTL
jgi:hypothetical protein